jgi:hypothetical protein
MGMRLLSHTPSEPLTVCSDKTPELSELDICVLLGLCGTDSNGILISHLLLRAVDILLDRVCSSSSRAQSYPS